MDIPLSSDALDLSFHPADHTNLVAVGLISGKIQLINYDDYAAQPSSSRTRVVGSKPPSKKTRRDAHENSAAREAEAEKPKLYRKVWVSRPSKKSCRGLHFSPHGDRIYSISKDKGLFATDVESGKVVDSWLDVHDAAPSRVLPIDEAMVVTGDDDGVVRLWDPRKGGSLRAKPVRSWDHHFDWITDMVYLDNLPVAKPNPKTAEGRKSKSQLKKARKKARQTALLAKSHASTADSNLDSDEEPSDDGLNFNVQAASHEPGRSRLVVTSGDGSLSSIDLRSSGASSFEQSEDQEDELLSITSIRSSSKLVVGTQLGILSLWSPSRGLLDHVDRVPGHPASVDTLVTLDSETVLTGSSDGLVRVVQILPSKLLGVIASHDGLPVERMKRKQSLLATIGHTNTVKFTDLTPLLQDSDNDDEDDQDDALGIVGLNATDSDNDIDNDQDEDEDEEFDFARFQSPQFSQSSSDQVGDELDDQHQEEEEEDEEEESRVRAASIRRTNTGAGNKQPTGFFSDLFDPTR